MHAWLQVFISKIDKSYKCLTPLQVVSLRVSVDLEVMVMNECTIFSPASELEPYHQILFRVIPKTPFLRWVSYLTA